MYLFWCDSKCESFTFSGFINERRVNQAVLFKILHWSQTKKFAMIFFNIIINVFLPSKSFPFSFNSFWCTFDDVTINANPLLLLVLSIKGKLTKKFCLRIYIDLKIKEFVKVLFNTIIVQISKKWLLLFWNVPVCTFNVQFLSWILFAIPWSEFTEWEFSLFLSGKFSQVCLLW